MAETLKDKMEHWAAAYQPFFAELYHLAVREVPQGVAVVLQSCKTGRDLVDPVVVQGCSERAFLLAVNRVELDFYQIMWLEKARYRNVPMDLAMQVYARVN